MKKIFIMLMLVVPFFGYAKNKSQENNNFVEQLINEKSFDFIAKSALPSKGNHISLSSAYDIKISGDTVVVYLPYYGRAYSAITSSDESGYKFTSTKNDFKVKQTKRGWDVTIKPTDVPNGVQLYLNISTTGHTMLTVTENKRDAIAFNGVLKQK